MSATGSYLDITQVLFIGPQANVLQPNRRFKNWTLRVKGKKKRERDKVAINNLILQCFSSLDFKYVGRNTASQEKKVFFLELYYMGSIFKLKISQERKRYKFIRPGHLG